MLKSASPTKSGVDNLFVQPTQPSVPHVSCQRECEPVPLTPTQEYLLETWLGNHKARVDPSVRQPIVEQTMAKPPDPAPPPPTREVLLANWLKKQREPARLQRRRAPIEQDIGKAQEPSIQTQEPCQGPPKDSDCLRVNGRPASQKKCQNPKWNDDSWFERRYGDPGYYSRVKGLM